MYACSVPVCRLWEKKQGRVEKNKNEREYEGMKLLLLKMEGSGIVIWRVNAGIMLSVISLENGSNIGQVGGGRCYVKVVTVDHYNEFLVFYL